MGKYHCIDSIRGQMNHLNWSIMIFADLVLLVLHLVLDISLPL